LAVLNEIESKGVVAVVRAPGSEQLLSAARALLAGGVDCIEITMTTPNALEVIADCRRELGDEALVGVGSVLSAEVAESAVKAGAEFVVSDPLMIFESENRPNTPSLFQVSFDPRGSFADAGHQIEYYLWEFGDGSFHIEESDLEVTHIYELAAMTKTVVARLTVFDDQGLEGTKTANITLTDPAGPGDIDEE